ncbi:DUF4232 domain-containing protein [Streptomyces bullii]|uniref:DUF4232 domain-containing protein n=1 Tax=Streptomyces bullii TaxID=349910 RepID=A0ABW0UM67_9ACTN
MRPATPLPVLGAVLAGAALVTSCGAEEPDSRGREAGSPLGGVSAQPLPTCSGQWHRYGDAPGTAGRPSEAAASPLPGRASPPPGHPADLERDGVRITALSTGSPGCESGLLAGFQITNRGAEANTYTITFSWTNDAGEAQATTEHTVSAVQPGRTVRRTLGAVAPGASRVRILEVRTVPTDQSPAPAGPCPSSGVRVYADEEADAAMGLRALSVRLENCGTRPYEVDGYPRLELLGEDHEPVTGVQVRHGGEGVASGTGADGAPRPVSLRPGERAHATLVWRNTVRHGEPVHAPYARVWAKPGAEPVLVTPELDLGTTGRLGVGPWKKEEEPPGDDRPPV